MHCFSCFSQQQPKSPEKAIDSRPHRPSTVEEGHLSPPIEYSPRDPPNKPDSNSTDSNGRGNGNGPKKSARKRIDVTSGSSSSLPYDHQSRHFEEVDHVGYSPGQVVPGSQRKKRSKTGSRSPRPHSQKSIRKESKTSPRYRRSDVDLERELEYEFNNLRPTRSEMSPDRVFPHSRESRHHQSNGRSVTLNTLHPGVRSQRKQDWYHSFVPPPRKESFALKNPNWYGGAGSVRNLVRQYEMQRRLSREERERENRLSPPPIKIDEQHTGDGEDKGQATAPPLTSNTDSNSSGKRHQQKKKVPFTFDAIDGTYPVLPPPPLFFAAPSAPPLTADVDPPPPPSPVSSLRTKADHQPFPDPPPEVLHSVLKLSTTESSDKNDDSSPMPYSDSLSSPLTQQEFATTNHFKEVRETYYSAKGEGLTYASNVQDRSENSERSRMGDFRSVEQAVGNMATRLKHPKLARSATRDRNPLNTITSRHMNARPEEQDKTRRYEMRKDFREKEEERQNIVPADPMVDPLEFDAELDKILRRGAGDDKEVTFARFQEPVPVYSKPWSKAVIAVEKEVVRKSNSESNSTSMTRVKAGKNAKVDERSSHRNSDGKILSLDDESMERSPIGSYIKKPSRSSTHIVRRLRGDVFEDKRGEVIFTVDARTGYEFSSTIALRTSDLSRYSITQTQRELRTGRATTRNWVVIGSGVTQKVVVDQTALSRGGMSTERRRIIVDRTRSLNDTMPSLTYDIPSDASDGL
ncbi:hypothetical protein RvY_09301 [Ramazzottius varieornatus]|uniref:Uncharacterized protein n=1 Tax=Ramazzottius varieornatus TaxID=947166 RepID=A0A1D1VEE6_RAMVA|nr:hypothetical protein RvY_09301 [Ramazzottius varieornatus]